MELFSTTSSDVNSFKVMMSIGDRRVERAKVTLSVVAVVAVVVIVVDVVVVVLKSS